MLVPTLAFLMILVLPVVFPQLPAGVRGALDAADLGIWAAFLAEYLAHLLVAPDRLSFILRNPFDLLLVASKHRRWHCCRKARRGPCSWPADKRPPRLLSQAQITERGDVARPT